MENFIEIWQSLTADEKQAMAERLVTHKDYLSQIAHGHRSPGKHFKIALERDLKMLADQNAAA